MPSIDENKPRAKQGQRSRKGKQPAMKPDQRQQKKADRQQDEGDLTEIAVALKEAAPVDPIETTPTSVEPSPLTTAVEPTEVASETSPSAGALVPLSASPVVVAAPPVETFWIGFRALAEVYRAYTWRSIEESLSLVEKLALARSVDKTVEIQNDFAKQACDNFVADSQKVWRLYSELARQIFRPLERLMMRGTSVAR